MNPIWGDLNQSYKKLRPKFMFDLYNTLPREDQDFADLVQADIHNQFVRKRDAKGAEKKEEFSMQSCDSPA